MECFQLTQVYTARALQQLELLRVDSKWTDIILRSEHGCTDFPAHRCILASASPYFSAMLGNDKFIEADKRIITIKDVSDDGLQLLLRFIYSGEIKLTVDKITDVLKVGTLTQVEELVKVCEKFLTERVDLDNVVDIWTHSSTFCLAGLQTTVLAFVGKNLQKIDSKVLFRFDGDFMGRLLKDTIISCLESDILSATVQWLQFNFKCREKYAKKFLKYIFWDRIHLRDTRAVAMKCAKPLRLMVSDASKRPSPSVPRGMDQGILLLGGFSIDGPKDDLRFLPIRQTGQVKAEWTVCGRLPTKVRRVDFGVCALPDGGVLLCGGTYLDENMLESRTSSTFIFDVHTNRWIYASPMKKVRSGCSALWFRNFVYVFGGDDGGPATCERYNICHNSWEFLGECPCQTEGFASCVVDNRILISGGLEETDRATNDFWSYEPESNMWTSLPPLPVFCSDHMMFLYDKKIFSVGGWTVDSGLHSVFKEVFSFVDDIGWQKESWEVPNLKAFQQYLFTGNQLLLVGGGSLKASQRLAAVKEKSEEEGRLEWFDLATKTWHRCQQLGVAASFWDHKTTCAFFPRKLQA